jgi:hypothetical protein
LTGRLKKTTARQFNHFYAFLQGYPVVQSVRVGIAMAVSVPFRITPSVTFFTADLSPTAARKQSRNSSI